jgi:hypothetical protein
MDWPAVYNDLGMSFGWTWEYIDRYVTLPRLFEIWGAWKTAPPFHQAFMAFVRALGKSGNASKPLGTSPSAPASETEHGSGDLLRDLAAAGVAMPAQGLSPALQAILEER